MVSIKELLIKIVNQLKIFTEVGAIYITTASTNPSSVFGGNWQRIQNKFLMGSSANYSVGDSGGTPDGIIPTHVHTFKANQWSAGSGGSSSCYTGSANRQRTDKYTSYTGVSATNKNLPPYYGVYIWQRVDGMATLTYNANGGSLGSIAATQTLKDNEIAYITSGTPTRSGYSFLGWSTNQFTTVAQYESGDIYKAAGTTAVNATLYAVWMNNNLTLNAITIDNQGHKTLSVEGGYVSGPLTCEYGHSLTLTALPNPGYQFRGWVTSLNSTEIISSATTYTFIQNTSNTTYYGIFEKALIYFSIDDITDAGYLNMTWDNWVKSDFNTRSHDIDCMNGYVISKVAQQNGKNKYLYTSRIDSNYPSNQLYPSESFIINGGMVIASAELIPNGAYFTGGYLNRPAITLATYTVIIDVVGSDYAQVTGDGLYDSSCLVTVKANPGTLVSNTTRIGEDLYLNPENVQFVGWFTNSSGSGTPLSTSLSYNFNITSNVHLYAIFEER